ncbi:MAG: hypothetical protein HY898_24615 [Deltaproteobacteria bacterium]|nr:hypothetical protein [Deltaproteobacteria bacterium]
MGGLGGRANSTSSGYTDDQRGGLLYGGGLFFAPNRRFAVGLSYQRQVGAQEQFEPGATLNSGKINRTYQSVLANLRAYPLRNDSVGLWGGLMIGAMFQTANATGTSTPAGVYASPSSYSIDAGPSGGMALGLGVGMDYDVSNSFGFLASVNMLNAWLKSDSMTNPPDRPVPGAGSVMMLDARVAFQYRFDTSGAALPVSGTVKTSKR